MRSSLRVYTPMPRKRVKPRNRKSLGLKSRVSKKPLRDDRHLALVRAHGCLICGKAAHAHHPLEAWPRTMGVLIGDDKTVPLCPTHHDELHLLNNMTFWSAYGIDPVKWALDFYDETLAMRARKAA